MFCSSWILYSKFIFFLVCCQTSVREAKRNPMLNQQFYSSIIYMNKISYRAKKKKIIKVIPNAYPVGIEKIYFSNFRIMFLYSRTKPYIHLNYSYNQSNNICGILAKKYTIYNFITKYNLFFLCLCVVYLIIIKLNNIFSNYILIFFFYIVQFS